MIFLVHFGPFLLSVFEDYCITQKKPTKLWQAVPEENCKLKDRQRDRLTDGQAGEQMRVKQYDLPLAAEIQKGEKTLKFTETNYENYWNYCF